MEPSPENNVGNDNSIEAPAVTVGAALREARERLGLSVAEAAGQTKLAPRQIEALENDDFQHLPEMTFVRGFVRNYAKILHLDAQPLLELLPQSGSNSLHSLPESVEVPFPDARLPQRQNLVWLGAALLLAVLVVVFAVWNYTAPVKESKVAQIEKPVALPAEMKIIAASAVPDAAADVSPASAASPSRPVVAKPPVPAAAKLSVPVATQSTPQIQPAKPAIQTDVPLKNPALRLTFGDESWVEIKDKDGNILSSHINVRGSELRLDGNAPFSLAIGRAASVQLYYRGKQVDLKPYINSSSEVARLTLE